MGSVGEGRYLALSALFNDLHLHCSQRQLIMWSCELKCLYVIHTPTRGDTYSVLNIRQSQRETDGRQRRRLQRQRPRRRHWRRSWRRRRKGRRRPVISFNFQSMLASVCWSTKCESLPAVGTSFVWCVQKRNIKMATTIIVFCPLRFTTEKLVTNATATTNQLTMFLISRKGNTVRPISWVITHN